MRDSETTPERTGLVAKVGGVLEEDGLLVVALAMFAIIAFPVLAQSGSSAAPGSAVPETGTADDEFSKQLSELKKTFADNWTITK